ncbi:MAG: hypothetical protein QW165_01180 [Candidatus Woesearchaeota archaeon]
MGANQVWAKVIGIVLILVGLLGFFMGGKIFGVATAGAAGIFYIVIGAIFAWAGFAANAPTKKVNTWLGAILLLVGLLGFFGMLEFLNATTANTWLHAIAGVVSAGIGWKAE